MADHTIFFSYSRDNSEFVLELAKELRSAGAKIWLDQLDIKPGTRWDKSIETALNESSTLLVVLSKSSVASNNVMDEVSYALEEGKTVVPVLLEECDIPFRLRRLQFADFSASHDTGIVTLTKALHLDDQVSSKLVHEATAQDYTKEKPKTSSNPVEKVAAVTPSHTTAQKPVSSKTPLFIIGGLVVLAAGLYFGGVFSGGADATDTNLVENAELTQAGFSEEVGDAYDTEEATSEVVKTTETSQSKTPIEKTEEPKTVKETPKEEIPESNFPVTGLNVTEVLYESGTASPAGSFEWIDGKEWMEVSIENNSEMPFREVRRDANCVELYDDSRGYLIRLDIKSKSVLLKTEPDGEFGLLYYITETATD